MPLLSIIIPCHNEEQRLNVGCICSFLLKTENVSIIFVNDGSTDNTQRVLETIKQNLPQKVEIIHQQKQTGKAEAVRRGLLHSCNQTKAGYHGFLDADLAISLDEFFRLFLQLCASQKKFIFGSRIKKLGSTITRNEWRHFYSRVIATITGFITKLDIYDTQCSAKIFDTETVATFASQPFKTRWLFDLEIASRINTALGSLQSGVEEPLIEWTEIKGSKLRWYHFYKIAGEIFTIYKFYRAK
jgi:dolichyl-phosphate beta-glucosyltransferase